MGRNHSDVTAGAGERYGLRESATYESLTTIRLARTIMYRTGLNEHWSLPPILIASSITVVLVTLAGVAGGNNDTRTRNATERDERMVDSYALALAPP